MAAPTWIFAVASGLLLAGHLVAEARSAAALRAICKVGASLAFVLLGAARGAHTPFGRWVLAGLVLSLVGDAILLSARRSAFLAGLTAFLLAHLAYAAAFAPLALTPLRIAAPLAGALVLVLLWLWPRLDGMRGPVVVYALVISGMLYLALGVGRTEVRLGALLFYLSDLFVARDRFVRPGTANRLVGLPLYYAGQLLLAAAVG